MHTTMNSDDGGLTDADDSCFSPIMIAITELASQTESNLLLPFPVKDLPSNQRRDGSKSMDVLNEVFLLWIALFSLL